MVRASIQLGALCALGALRASAVISERPTPTEAAFKDVQRKAHLEQEKEEALSCIAKDLGDGTIFELQKKDWDTDFATTSELSPRSYPLTEEMFRNWRPKGDMGRMKAVMRKLQKGKAVHIGTIGGSFSAAKVSCTDHQGREGWECSWNSRVRRWLEKSFPQAKITWNSVGTSGAATSVLLAGGLAPLLDPFKEPFDLLFVETLLHDATEARTVGLSMQESDLDINVGYESLLRGLRKMLPDTQLVAVHAACPECLKHRKGHEKVAQHYGIPIMDFAGLVAAKQKGLGKRDTSAPPKVPASIRDQEIPDDGDLSNVTKWAPPPLLEIERERPADVFWPQEYAPGSVLRVDDDWPNFDPPMRAAATIYSPENHPPWIVHQYVADFVARGLMNMFEDACKGNYKPKGKVQSLNEMELIRKFPVCTFPHSRYKAEDFFKNDIDSLPTAKSGPISLSYGGRWRLQEDKDAGRVGWVSRTSGSTLRFVVCLGLSPTLTVKFVRGSSPKYGGHVDVMLYPLYRPEMQADEVLESTADASWKWSEDRVESVPMTWAYSDAVDGFLGSTAVSHKLQQSGQAKFFIQGQNRSACYPHILEFTSQFNGLSGNEEFEINEVLSC